MGYKVTTPVWDHSKAKGSDLLVLLAIADSADNTTGDAYPSIQTLADLSRLSERGVRYSIRRLEAMGELSVCQRPGRKTSVYHVVLFDGIGAKFAPQEREDEGQSTTAIGAKFAPQEQEDKGQSTTAIGAIHDSLRGNPRQSKGQSTTPTYIVLEPVLKQPVLKQPERQPEPLPVEAGPPELHPQAGHAFSFFKEAYPKIAGKFLNEDLACREFLKIPGAWNQLILAAKNYGASSIVQGCISMGGKGVKYPNNFIRDGTWRDWITPEVVVDEGAAVAKKAKDELTAALKKAEDGLRTGDLSPDARRLFQSLHTHWYVLKRMALEGRDICGPQTSGVDVKRLAAEGSDLSCT